MNDLDRNSLSQGWSLGYRPMRTRCTSRTWGNKSRGDMNKKWLITGEAVVGGGKRLKVRV